MPSAGAASHPHNDPNEDAFRIEPTVFLVSDGVGAYRGAAQASQTVVQVAGDVLVGDWPPPGFERRRWLSSAVARSAQALHAAGQADRGLRDMSATLTMLLLRADEYALVNIGDSRAYLYRDGKLEQLSRDHSVGWEQFELGVLTKEALRTNPNQQLLTRAISAREAFAVPELFDGDVQAGDLFLLCTDGLGKGLSDEEVEAILRAEAPPQAHADALVAAARAAGTDDDVTVVVVQASST